DREAAAPLRFRERGAEVLDFAASEIVTAFRGAHAPEVETQRPASAGHQGPCRAKDNLVVERAAVKGVRVRDEGRSDSLARGLLPDPFESPGGPRERDCLQTARHRDW